jgi:hypothetical protein
MSKKRARTRTGDEIQMIARLCLLFPDVKRVVLWRFDRPVWQAIQVQEGPGKLRL